MTLLGTNCSLSLPVGRKVQNDIVMWEIERERERERERTFKLDYHISSIQGHTHSLMVDVGAWTWTFILHSASIEI